MSFIEWQRRLIHPRAIRRQRGVPKIQPEHSTGESWVKPAGHSLRDVARYGHSGALLHTGGDRTTSLNGATVSIAERDMKNKHGAVLCAVKQAFKLAQLVRGMCEEGLSWRWIRRRGGRLVTDGITDKRQLWVLEGRGSFT
jgi:hypothetical protein